MDIVFCADKKYIEQLAVTMKSIIIYNKDESIHFHIISSDLKQSDCIYVQNLLNANNNKNLNFSIYNIDINQFSKLYTMPHISVATYFRLCIAEILPVELKKVLYLDADILCVDKLNDFYNLDIYNYAVAAIRDAFNDDITFFNRLEYPIEDGYFNAGVLLINLDYWRNESVAKKSMEFAKTYPEKLLCSDQDILNKVLAGKVLWSDFRYNCILSYFYTGDYSDIRISINYKNEIERAANDPCIIHFVGPCKPWFNDYTSCFRTLYHKIYQDIFKHGIKKRQSIHGKELLKRRIKILLSKFGIKKYGDFSFDTTYSQLENRKISFIESNI